MSGTNNKNAPMQPLENNKNINMYQLNTDTQDTNKDSNGKTKSFWDKTYEISKIPCFRDSLLYGVGTAIGVTMISSIFSRSGLIRSADYGVVSFLLVSGIYWPICNYNKNIQDQKIKLVMDAQVAELNRKSEQHRLEKEKEQKQQQDQKK
ncbi:hypothetical protein DLAC_04745 [Tieghemostelium lacteum]|uniref:Cytochrome c oxidase assembly protein COX20, mitochondrial n=1 Tax=Tieghemostelium lacteum TaxID=361077 RepID=A0A151ZKC8_TIELA|nr:hypothetical protein DLAC_04745 [Tieghemostelium lacteum]|eukprot:KYQ94448.1 hypothetical protein DLAC_04745 [Tieghemostelium lacteum]